MEKKFDLSKYDDKYYRWFKDHTVVYILKTMDWYIDTYKPKSIIDYGCGIGVYLESGLRKGIKNLKGFDIGGESLKNYTDKKIQKYIEYIDCTELIVTKKYECVISLETGEHLETSGSDNFVLNIINSTDKLGTILFSAAQPGQKGTGHINCQPKQFWIDKFKKYNFKVDHDLTNKISTEWSKLKAPKYICDNLIVLKYQDS